MKLASKLRFTGSQGPGSTFFISVPLNMRHSQNHFDCLLKEMPKPHQFLSRLGKWQKLHARQEAQVVPILGDLETMQTRPCRVPSWTPSSSAEGCGSPRWWSTCQVSHLQAVLEKVTWVREYHGLGGSTRLPLLSVSVLVRVCDGRVRTCVVWVRVSASSCQGHCSCSGSLSSHKAHLFPTWPPSPRSSPLPDVRNLRLTSRLQQLQVGSWQNLQGLRGGVGGDL